MAFRGWAVALSLGQSFVQGSLQGLYAVEAPAGQLVRVDWTSGASTNVGAPLEKAGFQVEACAPATVHPTYKLYFTLARKASASANSPYELLCLKLGDGSVESSHPLPAAFPPRLTACDHALSIDDKGFQVHVSAVVDGAEGKVLTESAVEFKQGTDVSEFSVVLSSLQLGNEVAAPCSSFTDLDGNARLWHQLQSGVAGGDVKSHVVDKTLSTGAGSFCPFQFWNRDVYGVLQTERGSELASFDPQAELPSLTVSGPLPTPAKGGNAALHLWQEQQVALLIGTQLITVDFHGTLASNVTVCSRQPTEGLGCFSSMAYQPNVIAFV